MARNFTTTQTSIIESSSLTATWLFEITSSTKGKQYWSTKSKTFDAISYSASIVLFESLTMRRSSTEDGTIPTLVDASFTLENTAGTYSYSEFQGQDAVIKLVVSNGTDEEIIRTWKMKVKRAEEQHKTIIFYCIDFLTYLLQGEYPPGKLIQDLFPSENPDWAPVRDNMCLPTLIGTCFIPTRPVPTASERWYVLGEAGESYSVKKVRSPAEVGANYSEWNSTNYDMIPTEKTARDGTPIAVFQPIVLDSDEDGTPDAPCLWQNGNLFYDMPTKYSARSTEYMGGDQTGTVTAASSATLTDGAASWQPGAMIDFYGVNLTDGSAGMITDSGTTWGELTLQGGSSNTWTSGDSYAIGGPASSIANMLRKLGISSQEIDHTKFAAAEATFASWGLSWSGGLYLKENAETTLATMLENCNGNLLVTDSIELNAASSATVDTISRVTRHGEQGRGNFSYRYMEKSENDSGHVAFTFQDEPENRLHKILVPVTDGGATENISSDVLEIRFVHDSQNVQRLGILHYQKKFTAIGAISAICLPEKLGLDPGDVVKINNEFYGGTYEKCLIDSIKFNKNLSVELSIARYEYLDNFTDLSPTGLTYATSDDTYTYSPVYSGPSAGTPDGGNEPNKLAGKLVVGNYASDYVLIDGDNKLIQSSNYTSGLSGFHIDPSFAEFGNVAVRGILRTAVFQKDVVSAVGGTLDVMPSDVLAANMTALDTSKLVIEGNETFAVGDVLLIKDESNEEWMTVTAKDNDTYTVTRDEAGAYNADENPAWSKGSTVVNYRQSGDGWVEITSSKENAPYLSVNTHSGSPWTDAVTKVRVGNLNGYLGYVSDTFGLGIGEYAASKANLTFDPTNGIRMRSYNTIIFQIDNAGNAYLGNCEINGSLTVSDNIVVGTTGAIYTTGKTSFDDITAGFYLGYEGWPYDDYLFVIGDGTNNLKWDGHNVNMSVESGSSDIDVGATDGIKVGSGGTGNIRIYTGGNIAVAGNLTIESGGAMTIESGGDMTIDSGGKITVNADQGVYVGASGSIYLVGDAGGGGKIDFNGAGEIYYNTSTSELSIDGGSSGTITISQLGSGSYESFLSLYDAMGFNLEVTDGTYDAYVQGSVTLKRLTLGASSEIVTGSPLFRPSGTGASGTDLGSSSYPFKDAYLSGDIDMAASTWIGISVTDCLEFTSTSLFTIKGVDMQFNGKAAVGGAVAATEDFRVYANTSYPLVVRTVGGTNLLVVNSSGQGNFYGNVKAGGDGSGIFYCQGIAGLTQTTANPASITATGGIITAMS